MIEEVWLPKGHLNLIKIKIKWAINLFITVFWLFCYYLLHIAKIKFFLYWVPKLTVQHKRKQPWTLNLIKIKQNFEPLLWRVEFESPVQLCLKSNYINNLYRWPKMIKLSLELIDLCHHVPFPSPTTNNTVRMEFIAKFNTDPFPLLYSNI